MSSFRNDRSYCFTDHLGVCPAFYASDETETMNDVWSDPQAITGEWFIPLSYTIHYVTSTRLSARLQEWEGNGTGKIAHKSATMFVSSYGLLSIFISGIEAIMKVRPTAAQLTSTGPALQLRWETFFQHSPERPMAIIAPFAG